MTSKPRCPKCELAGKKQYERQGASGKFVWNGHYRCPDCGRSLTSRKGTANYDDKRVRK